MSAEKGETGVWNLLERCQQSGLFEFETPSITPLQGDASDRKFFRIRQNSMHFIALVSPRKNLAGNDENDSYFRIGRHLKSRNLPVPRILWHDLDEGYFLLEDLGDYHLQRHVKRRRISICRLYQSVIDLLTRMHRLAPEGFQPDFCFDSDTYSPGFVYQRELQYFREAFLNGFLGMEISEEDLRSDFENLAEAAGSDRESLVMHRDFQSRNIMVCNNGLWILDFQGMRFGPPAYDLASLMIDPYVAVHPRIQEQLCKYYWTGARSFLGRTYNQFRSAYKSVRLCRNLQVLAAYAFLAETKGKRQFLQFIPQAWQQLGEEFKSSQKTLYPKLEKLVRSIRKVKRFRTG